MREALTAVLVSAVILSVLELSVLGGRSPGQASGSSTTSTSAATSESSTSPGAAPAAGLDQQLRDAAWAGDVAAAQQLIAAGADVNAKDSSYESAYLISTSEGPLELVRLMLASGADLAGLDSYDGTGLIRAAERGLALIVGELVRPESTSTTSTTSATRRSTRPSGSAPMTTRRSTPCACWSRPEPTSTRLPSPRG